VLDMDSVPPATMQEAVPVMMVWVPRMMAFRPEAQTLLMVVQGTVSGRPAFRAHCRAGFWPRLWGKGGQAVSLKEKGRAAQEGW